MGRAGIPHRFRFFFAQTGGVRQAPRRCAERHLTAVDREETSRGIAAGESARRIARRLGRAPSAISRESARNGGREHYRATAADQQAHQRARRPKSAKLALLPALRAIAEEKPALSWSPEQISGWLRRRFPGDAAMQISHEAIYLSLYDPRRRQAIDRKLKQRLRTGRPIRQLRAVRRPTGWGIIRDMFSISRRPAEVGPYSARALGKRPRHGQPTLGHCHARRAHQPLHSHGRTTRRHQGRAGHPAPVTPPARHSRADAAHVGLGSGRGPDSACRHPQERSFTSAPRRSAPWVPSTDAR